MQIITISSKNQITLPSKKLKSLGFGKKAILETEHGAIKITPVKESIVGELAGSLKKYTKKSKLGRKWTEIIDETKKSTALRLVYK